MIETSFLLMPDRALRRATSIAQHIDRIDPVTGTPDYDTISAQQVDSHTARFTLKKGGKPSAPPAARCPRTERC